MATSEHEKVKDFVVGCPGIIKAKLAVMAEVRGVRKDRVNKHQGYEYIGHDDVTEALQDAFVKYGIAQRVSVFSVKREGELLAVNVEVTWTALEDGTQEHVFSYAEATSKAKTGRVDSVEAGAAVSYAVKTAQLKNFMLVGGGDYDNEERDTGRERQEPARREEPKSQPKQKETAGVSDEECQRWIDGYKKVETRKQLDEQRQKLNIVANLLTDEQYERLQEADISAAERVVD